ncbi:MAG TPA: hypothetical protein VNS63_01975 [Blastocatellia bacterium]|nr:hypothetical protein [Blastocatellia bacterium]
MSSKLKAISLCIAMLGAFGCGSTSSNKNAPAASATTPGPVSREDNPVDVLSRAINAQLEAKSFRARMLTSIDGGKESTRMVECVAPDRFHITGDQDEMIMAGGNVYMKNPGGEWTRLLFDPTEMMNQIRDSKRLDEIRKSTDVALVGADTVEGVPTLVYRYSMKDPFGMKFTSNCKMWVGLTDSLPRKMEVEGEFNKMKTKSVVTYYDYGADVKIEPPTNYKTQGGR